jgi:hypothetical protein
MNWAKMKIQKFGHKISKLGSKSLKLYKDMKSAIREGKKILKEYEIDFDDLQQNSRIDEFEIKRPNSRSNPIIEYETGDDGRIDYFKARVRPEDLRTGKRLLPVIASRSKGMDSISDSIGHVIGGNRGGSSDASNYFNHKSFINRGIWRNIEENVVNELESGNSKYVDISFNFGYDDQFDGQLDFVEVDYEYHKNNSSALDFQEGLSYETSEI